MSENTSREIWWDIGNVIIATNDDRMFRAIGALSVGPKIVEENLEQFQLDTQNNLQEMTIEDMYPAAVKLFGYNGTPEQFQVAWNSAFTPILETQELVYQLAPRYRQVVTSNINLPHWEYLQRTAPVLGVFDEVYLSFELEMEKPDRDYFREVLRVEGVQDDDRGNIVFIDDKQVNVRAAESLGITAHHYTDPQRLASYLRTELGLTFFPRAPMFNHDGSPMIGDDGRQVLLPFDEPVRANGRIFLNAGAVSGHEMMTAQDIKAAFAGRKTDELLGPLSPARLYYFNPREALVVSADGDLLIAQRSHRGASVGEFQHTAGGFPAVLGVAETAEQTAINELLEEQGLHIPQGSLIDLNCRSYNNEVSPFALPDTKDVLQPGATAEILDSFVHVSRLSTAELLEQMEPNCESIGMAVLTLRDLDKLANRQQAVVRYWENTAQFAQDIFDEIREPDEIILLSEVRDELLAYKMSGAERTQRGDYSGDEMWAFADPGLFTRRALAVGYAALEAAGQDLSDFGVDYLARFRAEECQKPAVNLDLPLTKNRPVTGLGL